MYGAVAPIARVRGPRNQGAEMGVAPLIITSSDPLAKCLLPVSVTLCSADLEVLAPKTEMFPPGNPIVIPLH